MTRIDITLSAILFLFAVSLAGCAPDQSETLEKKLCALGRSCTQVEDPGRWIEKNPCGVLHVRRPLAEVGGVLTRRVRKDTSIYLFVAPDASFNTSLFVVRHCPPIARGRLVNGVRFSFPALPQDSYVVRVDADPFGSGRGFPVVTWINDSRWALNMTFHGGDSNHSIAAFSIRPRDSESTGTEG